MTRNETKDTGSVLPILYEKLQSEWSIIFPNQETSSSTNTSIQEPGIKLVNLLTSNVGTPLLTWPHTSELISPSSQSVLYPLMLLRDWVTGTTSALSLSGDSHVSLLNYFIKSCLHNMLKYFDDTSIYDTEDSMKGN